jgi:hypothetical protein
MPAAQRGASTEPRPRVGRSASCGARYSACMPRALTLSLLALVGVASCASRPEVVELRVSADEYPRAFQAAKDVLRDASFELDRVDASVGIITTSPRPWAGFMSPWVPHATGGRSALEGFAQNERRVARVIFAPVESPGGGASAESPDRVARVEVEIQHVERPGRRVSVASARLTSQWTDPRLLNQGLQPSYAYSAAADPDLAARLLRDVSDRMSKSAEPAPAAPE